MLDINIIIPVITTLLGVILGALIGVTKDTFDRKRVEKQEIKITIFLLLNIRNLVVKSNLENFITNAFELINQKSGKRDNSNNVYNNFVKELYQCFILNILNEVIFENLKTVRSDYEKSINIIAKYNPILAYENTSKNVINEYIIDFDGFINKADNLLSQKDCSLEDCKELLLRNTNNESYNHIINTIDREINTIAKEGGDIKKRIQQTINKQSMISKEELNHLFENKGIIRINRI